MDDDQLSGIALEGKEAMTADQLKAGADMGYYHGHEIKTCEGVGSRGLALSRLGIQVAFG